MPVGKLVYSAMLNARGGFESDLTVMRLAADRFQLITGSAQPQRDLDWITRHIDADEHVVVTDVSAMTAVLSLMGPRSHDLMQRVSPDDVSPQGLKFSHTREIDLGLARVRAARMSYVGGPGYELYVPIEMARHVYLALHEAGRELGLTDAGYYAIDALRIEAGRRAWGAELGPGRDAMGGGPRLRREARQDRELSSVAMHCAPRRRSRCARSCWPSCSTIRRRGCGAARRSSSPASRSVN